MLKGRLSWKIMISGAIPLLPERSNMSVDEVAPGTSFFQFLYMMAYAGWY
jgi:hypothetical protein